VALLEEHHPAPLGQALKGRKGAGAVHEGACREEGGPGALGPHDPSDVGGRAVVAVAAGPGAVQPGEEVVLSHITPFGTPVVPPV